MKHKKIKGWAIVSKRFPYIFFCAVSHDEEYAGKRNVIVKMVKKMIGIETKLCPCEIILKK